MRAHEIAAQLEAFTGRGPGSNAERRAASWLARELENAGAEVRIDPFWCRPNWALAHAWHAALVIVGSLVSVGHPRLGAVLLVVALVSIVSDAVFGVSAGRRLTRERASQNLIVRPRSTTAGKPLRLVISANYDAGRTGLVYRDRLRGVTARLRRATGGFAPGWLGWLCLATLWLIAVAVLREEHHRSTVVAIAQFVPTVLLVVTFAALLELATADYGPAGNDNGSGAAVAVALAAALAAAPPGQMDVELVLAGAGEGGGIGLMRHLRRRSPGPRLGRLRRRRPELDRTNAAVLGFAASGAGTVHYWTSDGSLIPLRYSGRFRRLCEEAGGELGAAKHTGRGTTPGWPARLRGIPAIALGCLDQTGTVPRSHRRDDTAAQIEAGTLDATVEFALILVDALDSFLASTPSPGPNDKQATRSARNTAGRAHDAPAVPAGNAPGHTVGRGADI